MSWEEPRPIQRFVTNPQNEPLHLNMPLSALVISRLARPLTRRTRAWALRSCAWPASIANPLRPQSFYRNPLSLGVLESAGDTHLKDPRLLHPGGNNSKQLGLRSLKGKLALSLGRTHLPARQRCRLKHLLEPECWLLIRSPAEGWFRLRMHSHFLVATVFLLHIPYTLRREIRHRGHQQPFVA
jgi:hypothetical protein